MNSILLILRINGELNEFFSDEEFNREKWRGEKMRYQSFAICLWSCFVIFGVGVVLVVVLAVFFRLYSFVINNVKNG